MKTLTEMAREADTYATNEYMRLRDEAICEEHLDVNWHELRDERFAELVRADERARMVEQPAQSTADKSELETVPTKGGLLPAQQEPWGFHIQFNNGKDATFKGLDYLTECEAHQEAGETITLLYIKEKNT